LPVASAARQRGGTGHHMHRDVMLTLGSNLPQS
jgi:hypothetical protein